MDEAAVSQLIRLDAAQSFDAEFWRNNSGAFQDDSGRWVRFGLGNDSTKINKRFKSPDLVGIVPVIIRPEHVGRRVGIFTGIEVKHEGWRMPNKMNDRLIAQERFMSIIIRAGGFAGFASSVADFRRIIHAEIV